MGGGSCGEHPPLLEIVLGTFSGLENINNAPTASTTIVTKSAAPETLFTLATSYYASPSLKSRLKLNKDGRVPMEDRKGAFDQFKPRSLLLSVSYYNNYCVCYYIWFSAHAMFVKLVVLILICIHLYRCSDHDEIITIWYTK